MAKIRLTRTMVVEYEPDPNFYPEHITTIEQMAEWDTKNGYKELDFEDPDSDEVRYEIIEEGVGA